MSNSLPTLDTGVIRFAEFEVDLSAWVLRRKNLRVPLQKKPFQILRLLLSRPGQLVTRVELAHELWPELQVSSERCLNTAVNLLRRALDDLQPHSRLIETRPGLGYCFVGPINSFGNQVEVPPPDGAEQLDLGYYFLHRSSPASFARARACFHAALGNQELAAAAHRALAELESLNAVCGHGPTLEAAHRALLHARAAQSIDPTNAEAQIALAVASALLDGDHEYAIQTCSSAFSASLLKASESVSARFWLAGFLCSSGRAGEAVEHLQSALRIRPISLLTRAKLSLASYLAGNYEAAVEQAWAALCIEPSCAEAQLTLAMAYQQLGNLDDAVTEFENAVSSSEGGPAALAGLCHALHASQRPAAASAVADRFVESSKSNYVSHCWCALVQLASGERAAAGQSLSLAVEKGDYLLGLARHDPRFALVRWEDGPTSVSKALYRLIV